MDNTLQKFLLAFVLAFAGYFLALSVFDQTQARLIGVVVLLVTLWTNEALPLGVVSLLPIVLFPALGILNTPDTTNNYAKSIIFLFLGGFLLAIAVEKTGLHKRIANKIITIFPKSARGLIFALAITSAVLSSLLSNTTTALLLMPIAMFLTQIKELKVRFVLAIAYGASIGGVITPIGTPPNLILMGFMQSNDLGSIAFFQWMLKTIPLAAIMLIVVPYVLSLGVNHFKLDLEDEIKNKPLNSDQSRLKNILIALVVILMANSPIKPFYDGLGLGEAGILLTFGLFMMLPKFGFLNWDDTKKIPYEIIFLFGAGFSIAAAFSATNLAHEISQMLLQLTDLPTIILLLLVATLVTFTTEVTSNTALISIALPIIYALGMSSPDVDAQLVLMVATICASYAFMLPIATPPNAIAMSSRAVSIKQMAKFGFIFNILAITLTSIVAYFLW